MRPLATYEAMVHGHFLTCMCLLLIRMGVVECSLLRVGFVLLLGGVLFFLADFLFWG